MKSTMPAKETRNEFITLCSVLLGAKPVLRPKEEKRLGKSNCIQTHQRTKETKVICVNNKIIFYLLKKRKCLVVK